MITADNKASALSQGWVIYLRVSDEDKQTPERSFAMQRQRIEEHLLTGSGLPVQREYCDILTGTTPKRADYQQMLADAERGTFSHLALYRADRFGRNAMEGLQAATKLISAGIKIRVANMPSLCPETPDGFFMFMLQMGLAQREVEVLRERTADGMEAKLRAGGWAHKAPAGYLNKEILVSSNKYHRWVEIDPEYSKVIRLAWDLLLTRRYTLKQICDELDRQGYVRPNGAPWAWKEPLTGFRRDARTILTKVFHNPFYAGWATSKRFGIAYGEVRGTWEPIVTSEEYERGLDILHEHDNEKSRNKRRFYLLRGLLWLEMGDRRYRMYVSTTRGKYHYYGYYLTHASPEGNQVHIPCARIDEQVEGWLSGISISPKLIPDIREAYLQQITQTRQTDREDRIVRLQQRIRSLKDEELRLARLLLSNKIAEDTFDRLRSEWKEKVRQSELDLQDLESDTSRCLDDLDVALCLLTTMTELYARMNERQRATLLQIVTQRIMVNADGQITDHVLHAPFSYLVSLRQKLEQDRNVAPVKPHCEIVQSEQAPEDDLTMLRFAHRSRLGELGVELGSIR